MRMERQLGLEPSCEEDLKTHIKESRLCRADNRKTVMGL